MKALTAAFQILPYLADIEKIKMACGTCRDADQEDAHVKAERRAALRTAKRRKGRSTRDGTFRPAAKRIRFCSLEPSGNIQYLVGSGPAP